MPDDPTSTPPPNPTAPNIEQRGQTFSPSPDPGMPQPQRRMEDTKSYAGEWTILLLALLGWATSFCADMAQEESFQNMFTPKFMGTHVAQLFTVTVSVLAAKRLK